MWKAAALLTLIAALFAPAALPATKPESTQPPAAARQLVSRFLAAFENLDLPAFIACFADDATVFFPTPEPPQRFDGKAAIREHFDHVFAAIRRNSDSPAPPYHKLDPEDLEFQLVNADTVVVTFHLRNAERLGRRTLVLANVHGTWLIVHLHASNTPVSQPTPHAPPQWTGSPHHMSPDEHESIGGFSRAQLREIDLVSPDYVCILEGIFESAQRAPSRRFS
jgi:ketosteroid isomerase-like protein